jgi:hypothetical protein
MKTWGEWNISYSVKYIRGVQCALLDRLIYRHFGRSAASKSFYSEHVSSTFLHTADTWQINYIISRARRPYEFDTEFLFSIRKPYPSTTPQWEVILPQPLSEKLSFHNPSVRSYPSTTPQWEVILPQPLSEKLSFHNPSVRSSWQPVAIGKYFLESKRSTLQRLTWKSLHMGGYEVYSILGCDVLLPGRSLPMFRRQILL